MPGTNVTHAEMREALRQAPRGAIVRAVYAAVMLHIGKNGEPCTASIQTIADEAGVNIKTAKRALQDLVPVWLERTDTPGKSTRFTIPTPPAPRAHPETGPPGNGPTRPAGPEVKNPRSTTSERAVTNGSLFEEPAEPRAPKRTRARDELFDALILAASLNPDNLTASQRSQTAKAARSLRAVGATPDEIAGQALAMQVAWGTPPAPWTIEKNWNRPIGAKPRRQAPAWTPKEKNT